MRLTVVGSTGSMSGPEAPASGYLLQAEGVDPSSGEERTWTLLFDIGPGVFGHLMRVVNPRDVDALLVSHGHADHVGDAMSFSVYLKWGPEEVLPPLLTVGPPEILHRFSQIDGYATEEELRESFDFRPTVGEDQFQIGPFLVESFRAVHSVPAVAYRITGPSSIVGNDGEVEQVVVTYTGDTDLSDDVERASAGADLLLAECGFTGQVEVRGIHLDGFRAGWLARESGVGQLVLTHIQPWTAPANQVADAQQEFSGPVSVARQGSTWLL